MKGADAVGNDAPIGVFDSGIGGLTVVKELRRLLPAENLIYVGDTARVPYGSREPEEIVKFMHQTLRFFCSRKVKMAVYACNTMTAWGYASAGREYSFPLVPMNSGVAAALSAGGGRKVGVIATQGTVQNEMHRKAARLLRAETEVYAKACPDFVPLIESGVVAGGKIERAAEKYLEFFKGSGVDALILGCTHYPLIGDVIQKYAGSRVRLVNPAEATAADALEKLRETGLLNEQKEAGSLKMFFSADMEKCRRMAQLVVNGEKTEFRAIDLTQFAESV